MKKIFLILLLGLFFIPVIVNAETITIPKPKFNIDTTDGTLSSDGVLASWWGTNNYYESYYPIFKLTSTTPITTGANVQIPNVNWCDGQQVRIVGRLAMLENFFQNASLSHWATNGGKPLTCSYTRLGSGDEMEFNCVGNGGQGFMIGFSILNYDMTRDYSFGISRNFEVTCDASNLSVIENQNQNKNEIINNNNQNTNEIKNSIGSMGASINSNIDSMKDKQDQTNKELGDLNDNITSDNISDASSSANEFFTGFESNDHGLTAIITAPLNFIKSITSATCTPLGFPLPFVDKRAELPCMKAIYQEHFGSFLTLYQTITFGIVAYWVCVNTLAIVRGFKDPDSDRIEVLDL